MCPMVTKPCLWTNGMTVSNYRVYVQMQDSQVLSPYMGETTETVAADIGGSGYGHSANHGEVTVLKFGDVTIDKAHLIGGERNLMSHLDRIMRRIRRGDLKIGKLEILVSERE